MIVTNGHRSQPLSAIIGLERSRFQSSQANIEVRYVSFELHVYLQQESSRVFAASSSGNCLADGGNLGSGIPCWVCPIISKRVNLAGIIAEPQKLRKFAKKVRGNSGFRLEIAASAAFRGFWLAFRGSLACIPVHITRFTLSSDRF